MKKKLTERSFDSLKDQFIILSEDQQMSFVGGGYFEDNGIGYYDNIGNYHWARTGSDGNDSIFAADSWDSSSSSGPSGSGLFNPNPISGYGTTANPLSIDDYNTLAKGNNWHGGYVKGLGYIDIYASSVHYGNSIYLGGSWYEYGGYHCPLSESEFYKLIDEGKWHGGYVQGWGQVSAEVTILGSSGSGSSNNNSFDIYAAVNYLSSNALNSSAGACAKYVRLALEAGGLSTEGRPGSASGYDSYLPRIGFSVVTSSSGYTPQSGDIIVHEATSGHEHGHIAMYDGSRWISDFIQTDMFGGSAYRNSKDYTILRWNR